MTLSIDELCDRSWANAEEKGFHRLTPDDYEFPSKLLAPVQLLAEAVEENRHNRHPYVPLVCARSCVTSIILEEAASEARGFIPFRGRMMLVVTEIAEAVAGYQQGDKANVAEELADMMIRIADTARQEGLDLQQALLNKLAKNEQRPEMHGKQY